MDVKGWLIVGQTADAQVREAAAFAGRHFGVPPDTTYVKQGTMIEWIATPGGPPVVLVCVSIPIMPGLA